VAEGRNRDLVAEMIFEFAPVLLEHLRAPGYVSHSPSSREELIPLRQVWLPNPSHLEMLHHLAYAYMYTRWGDEMRERLNTFGRSCLWLFNESQRPGQQHVVVATEGLRAVYTFPAEDVRQGHLGFLLSWLRDGTRAERLEAAMAAEWQSIATNLDPDVERDQLEASVTRWTEARRADDSEEMAASAREIEPVLASQLTHRFDLTSKAIGVLRKDRRRENNGLKELVAAAAEEQWEGQTVVEKGFRGEPDGYRRFVALETDRYAAAAANRYFTQEESEDRLLAALLHDDRELLAEKIAAGEAFRGEIIEVRDEGEGRATRPVWVIEQPFVASTRLRPGSRVCVLGHSKREAFVRDLHDGARGGYVFEVEITGHKTAQKGATGQQAIPPADPRWEGKEIVFVETSAADIAKTKSFKVWKKDGPGSWLTHQAPSGVLSQAAPEENRNAEAPA
jgi:hypothetical protein